MVSPTETGDSLSTLKDLITKAFGSSIITSFSCPSISSFNPSIASYTGVSPTRIDASFTVIAFPSASLSLTYIFQV